MEVDASDRILSYQPSRALEDDSNEWRDTEFLCEALKEFSLERWQTFIADNAGKIVLEYYASDGTEHKTCKCVDAKSEDLSQKRFVVSPDEWLVERKFMFAEDGKAEFLCSESRVLEDKTAWSHYSAYASHEMLREVHDGWNLHVHCWDGAVRSAMERHVHQRHQAFDQLLKCEHDDMTAMERRMKSVVLV